MTEQWEQEFQTLFDECYELICRKQRDYGTGNIESFGSAGVLVRLSDKLARLKHLMTSGQVPENESLEDTWRDIVNYGIIGLALERDAIFHPPVEYQLVEVKA